MSRTVRPGCPPKKRCVGRRPGHVGRIEDVIVGKRLYVGNLPYTMTEQELRELFAEHGSVDAVDVIMDRETGRPRGFAFVEMDNADAAIEALNGREIGGRTMRVDEANERPRR